MTALQHELKKKRPFDHPEQEAYLNLSRTYTDLHADFALLFRKHGLTEQQYNVLRILRGAGDPGLPSLEIAGRMITRACDITRLLDRMEANELVVRERISDDRRVVLARITPTGRRLLDQLDEPVVTLHRTQLGHLTRAELKELNRLMVKTRRKE